MKILSLDISTKTGYCVLEIDNEKYNLIESGTIKQQEKPKLDYPDDYLMWGNNCANDIINIIKKHNPDHLVIEETSKGSKNNFSQKILEFIHYLVGKYIVENKIPRTYYFTEQWRRICGCVMNDAEKAQGKSVRTQRKDGIKVAKNLEGKRIGKITRKHVNVRRANEIFNLNLILKNEDQADSLLLAYAYYLEELREVKEC